MPRFTEVGENDARMGFENLGRSVFQGARAFCSQASGRIVVRLVAVVAKGMDNSASHKRWWRPREGRHLASSADG
jgi:hypothetical protein